MMGRIAVRIPLMVLKIQRALLDMVAVRIQLVVVHTHLEVVHSQVVVVVVVVHMDVEIHLTVEQTQRVIEHTYSVVQIHCRSQPGHSEMELLHSWYLGSFWRSWQGRKTASY